jgi:hypothetical protein
MKPNWSPSVAAQKQNNMNATIPQLSTELTLTDILGNWKVRWGIGRMDHLIAPGLYRIGRPDKSSPVLVTANYKLTVNTLRKELTGLNVWLLILDTKGVNVWCAAGKGTFGTAELINRIKKADLAGYVEKRTIILPQLGAPGVSAHEVKKQTGFSVIYGPVRAQDIPDYLNSGLKKTPEMSKVTFNLSERLAVIPIELVMLAKWLMFVLVIWAIAINLLETRSLKFSPGIVRDIIALLGAALVGCVGTPILLPWIPARSFAIKGFLLGMIWTLLIDQLGMFTGLKSVSNYFILPMISAFLSLNYTGASTYTSPSGALLEVKSSMPVILTLIGTGMILRLVFIFI